MNRIVKYSLIAAAVAMVLVAGVAAYIAATFDPNAYKPQAIAWVKERTGRTLTLPGEVRLALFPHLGITAGKATLSERGSEVVFASVEQLRLSLELLALLKRQVRIDDVRVQGLQVELVRGADGRLNIDDLLGAAGATPAEPGTGRPSAAGNNFAIDSLSLTNAAVTYRDEEQKVGYTVSDLALKTGRIAPDQPGTIDFAGRVHGVTPKLDLALQGRGGVAFAGDGKRFAIKDLALEAKGEAADVTGLAAKVRGSVDVDLAGPAVAVAALAIAASGKRDLGAFELDLAVPGLQVANAAVGGEGLALQATLRQADGQPTHIVLHIPQIEGSAESFHAANTKLEVEVVRPAQTLKASATGAIAGRLRTDRLQLAAISVSPLTVQPTLSGTRVPNQSVTGSLQGSAAVDFGESRAQADLAGIFDQSQIKARLNVAGFSPPAYRFDVDIDQLDLTRYQAAASAAPAPAPAPDASPAAQAPIDLSALRRLNANGSIRIGALKTPKIKASNVRIEMKAQNGRVELDPVAASLYGGSLTGTVAVNTTSPPEFAVKQTLTGVNVGALLSDVAQFQRLEGRGNFSMNVTTAGETVGQLKKGLNGTAAALLANGAIKGVDIAATIRQAKAAIGELKGKPVTEQADTTRQTEFAELKASFTIRHGIASNRDLTGKSPVLRLAGEGDIDLGNDRMNYLLKASLVEGVTGQSGKEAIQIADITVPVRVTGPIGAPSYTFDYATMAADLAQQALRQELQRKLGGKLPEGLPTDILQDAVKGLLKR